MKFLNKINGITVLVSALTFLIGWQLGGYQLRMKQGSLVPEVNFTNQAVPADKSEVDFKLFWDTWNLVSQEYVDKKAIDPQKMFYGAIQGMVAAVGDPYTVFLPPEQQKATTEELGGSFEGVGMQLGFNKDNRLVVQAPLKDTPAYKAGVQAGDIIVKIGDKDAANISIPDAVNLIRGKKGTEIAIEIYHEGDDQTKTVSLKRDTIVVKSVEYQAKTTPGGKKVAYIQLTRFGERTFDEWSEAVSQALAGAPQAVILDVRNNPGGYLDGAVFIGSEFIQSGEVYIKTIATQIMGVNGSGRERAGFLKILGGPSDLMNENRITGEHKGAILVTGGLVFGPALKKAMEHQVDGIISGGLNMDDYLSIAGSVYESHKSHSDIGMSLIATEGFGPMPIGNDIYNVLKQFEGRYAFINGFASHVILPQGSADSIQMARRVSLPPISGGTSPKQELQLVKLVTGMKVRIAWAPFAGNQGVILSVDQSPTLLPSGVSAICALVELPNNKIKVPVDNLEAL